MPAPGDNQGRTFNAILKYSASFKVRLYRVQADSRVEPTGTSTWCRFYITVIQGRTFNAILKYRAAFKVRLGRQQAIGQFNKFVPNSKIVENSLPVELPTALNSRPINPCHMVVHKLGTRYNMSHVAATIPQTLIIIININVTSYWVYSSSLTCKYSIVPDNSNKGE